jgi:endoglucanase
MRGCIGALAAMSLSLSLGGCSLFKAVGDPVRGGFVAKHGKLRVDGLQLTDSHGDAVQLRGVSFFWILWHEENLKASAVSFMRKNMGTSVIRIPVPAKDYANKSTTYDAQVSTMVGWARDNGVYAIIDWHMEDKDVIARIRKADSSTIIIVGTPEWSRKIGFAARDPLTEDAAGNPVKNIMYTYHGYASTHGMKADVEPYIDKIPLFSTEWGVSEANGSGRQDWARAREFVDFLRDNPYQKVSWSQWSWVDKRETSALLQPGTGGLSWQLSAAGDSNAVWASYPPESSFPGWKPQPPREAPPERTPEGTRTGRQRN